MPLDRPRFGVSFAEDQGRLAPGLVAHLRRCLLGRDERRAKEALELAEADEVGLELLDPVCEVRTLAPYVLEAGRDLLEELVGGRGAVAAEKSTRWFDVSDLDGCE